jgi:CubicO group peptidase (beta-lactamase class C family)
MDSSILQPLLESGTAKYAVPGAQLGLLRGAERVVVNAGVRNRRDNRPVVESTTFHAGSIAKALTGLVILDAARNGALDLGAPCASPSSKAMGVLPGGLPRMLNVSPPSR